MITYACDVTSDATLENTIELKNSELLNANIQSGSHVSIFLWYPRLSR